MLVVQFAINFVDEPEQLRPVYNMYIFCPGKLINRLIQNIKSYSIDTKKSAERGVVVDEVALSREKHTIRNACAVELKFSITDLDRGLCDDVAGLGTHCSGLPPVPAYTPLASTSQ